MYEISKRDALVLLVLANYGCPASVEYLNEDSVQFWIGSGLKGLSKVWVNEGENFTSCLISTLKTLTPKAGTPNAELTDEQKGLIQLLFEVEKALEGTDNSVCQDIPPLDVELAECPDVLENTAFQFENVKFYKNGNCGDSRGNYWGEWSIKSDTQIELVRNQNEVIMSFDLETGAITKEPQYIESLMVENPITKRLLSVDAAVISDLRATVKQMKKVKC